MVRWKLRSRSKSTKDADGHIEGTPKETTEPLQSQEPLRKEPPEPEENPVLDYNEVLYTQPTYVKKGSFSPDPKKEQKQRTSWENPSTVEQNVDRIGITKTETVASNPHVSDHIEKKVDRLIAKKKSER